MYSLNRYIEKSMTRTLASWADLSSMISTGMIWVKLTFGQHTIL